MADSRDGSENNTLSDRELDYDEDDDHDRHNSFQSDNGNDDDLFDTALEPTANSEKHENVAVVSSAPPTTTVQTATSTTSINAALLNSHGKRYCCYVGNMTWWTTDEDLGGLVKDLGVDDLLDIKFYENRNNGQSKGYALVMFASEPSVKTCLEVLPSRLLHNQSLVVLPYTKASLAKFEEATKRLEARNDKKDQKTEKQPGFVGTVRLGAAATAQPQMGAMGLNQMRPQFTGPAVPLMRVSTSAVPGVNPAMSLSRTVNLTGPPPQALNTMNRPPPSYGGRSLTQPPPAFPPPGAHINPNVYPGFATGQIVPPTEQLSEAEFEEVMSRNRTVATSAITRAVQDAASGDINGAYETLSTAMSLIRQSRVAYDERCKALVNSLQDTLHGLESKSSYSSRKHRSGRDRSRTPERSRKRHRRSRSRSRSRDRSDRYDYSPRHRRY
uniref:RRM domain-containing protein n=1 Tax=Steinernema glaseri TaxID=37863 RepID=A0A1I8A9P0_9BILA